MSATSRCERNGAADGSPSSGPAASDAMIGDRTFIAETADRSRDRPAGSNARAARRARLGHLTKKAEKEKRISAMGALAGSARFAGSRLAASRFHVRTPARPPRIGVAHGHRRGCRQPAEARADEHFDTVGLPTIDMTSEKAPRRPMDETGGGGEHNVFQSPSAACARRSRSARSLSRRMSWSVASSKPSRAIRYDIEASKPALIAAANLSRGVEARSSARFALVNFPGRDLGAALCRPLPRPRPQQGFDRDLGAAARRFAFVPRVVAE